MPTYAGPFHFADFFFTEADRSVCIMTSFDTLPEAVAAFAEAIAGACLDSAGCAG
jgi:hypothetical protein